MSRVKLGVLCCVCLVACTSEPMSVGMLPCDAEASPCDSERPELLMPQIMLTPGRRGNADVVWRRPLAAKGCSEPSCVYEKWALFAHDDGASTVAAVVSTFDEDGAASRISTRLWVARFDEAGDMLFENDDVQPFEDRSLLPTSDCPDERGACIVLRSPQLTTLVLQEAADGRLIALVGAGDWGSEVRAPRGRFAAYAIEPSGRVVPAFVLDPLGLWPLFGALAGEEPVLADGAILTRYSTRSEQRWRREDFTRVPTQQEFGGGPEPAEWAPSMLQLGTDGRGRVWSLLDEGGVYGLVQFGEIGRTDWHAWVPPVQSSDRWGGAPLSLERDLQRTRIRPIFDLQGRAVFAANDLGVVRVAAEADGPAQREAVGSVTLEEEFYQPDVFGLALDAEDRIYVATQEGPRSAPRMRVDRISADFATRDSYVVAVPSEIDRDPAAVRAPGLPARGIAGLGVGSAGHIYALISDTFAVQDNLGLGGLDALITTSDGRKLELVRLRLPELDGDP